MKKCINTMKVRTFNPGDIIITSMTVGTTMSVAHHGCLAVALITCDVAMKLTAETWHRYFIDVGAARASVNGVAATDLKSGDYFGEIAFLATCKKVLGEKVDEAQHQRRCPTLRQADVVATASSRMLEFSVKDFLTVLKKNPDGNKSVLASLTRTCDQRLDNVERIQRQIRHHESSVQEAMGSSGMWF